MKRYLWLCLLLFLTAFSLADAPDVGPPEIELKFPQVAELDPFIENYKKNITEEVMQQFEETKAEGGIYNQWSLELEGAVTYKGPFWVMVVRGYDYRGGAHGMPYLDALYFDGETKESIGQESLFPEESYEKLSELCRADLVKQGFQADDEWMLRGTEPTPKNYQLIVPNDEGVEVFFNAYQVAPYAAGVPSVSLAWSDVNDLLVEKYRPDASTDVAEPEDG